MRSSLIEVGTFDRNFDNLAIHEFGMQKQLSTKGNNSEGVVNPEW